MKLIIVSGLSGSGKSGALRMLEDLGYFCIDNIPLSLLEPLIQEALSSGDPIYEQTVIGVDARANSRDIPSFGERIQRLRDSGLHCEILFLQADNQVILKRFNETRRKHPLSTPEVALVNAIELERTLLSPLAAQADLIIDTSHTTIHELRNLISERVHGRGDFLSLLFKSFGYKHGVPSDADFVFDIRCLPNPHWIPNLRAQTGKDPNVIDYLDKQPDVLLLFEDIKAFLTRWLPAFEKETRSYITIAIGCTGGQHRSVYMVERLAAHFSGERKRVLVRHTQLP